MPYFDATLTTSSICERVHIVYMAMPFKDHNPWQKSQPNDRAKTKLD